MSELFKSEEGRFPLALDEANRVYVAKPYAVSESFIKKMKDVFDADAQSIDFSGK